ncbi:nucleotidyltransferase domain-containing protein [Actinopolymorpha sp. B17G11]|uniref:nucleotidyltransferase domain-containing protein n=1 Tax=Actinopolymorpha sp. B17G11 TaxID=3160861 RepID=UPI0032E389EA
MSALYGAMLDDLVDEAKQEEDVVGVLLTGSLARGDALPGTDIDLRLILADGLHRPAQQELRDGILVERGYSDVATARATLEANPMHVYAYLDGRILYDPLGVLPSLRQQAQRRFDTYQVTGQERSDLAARLRYPQDKIRVAMSGGDLLKAAFVTGTSSWGIMEGLWAANNRPLPPNSSVQPHLQDLAGPADVEALYRQLFLSETRERVRVALDLFDWILSELT